MGMGGGSASGGLTSDINVTPMIDVLLVLLIIFMVIVPVTPKGLDALVPQPPKNPQKEQDNDRTIVVQITHRPGGGETGVLSAWAGVCSWSDVNRCERARGAGCTSRKCTELLCHS